MDRTEFFAMAQKVAVYTNKCKNLSKPLLEDCIVTHRGIKYYPQFIQVGYDEQGKVINVAILHDLYANSITDVDLERVEKVSKFSQKIYRNVGELSSKYAYDKDGKQFESDIQRHIDESEKLYAEFVEWMKIKGVTPDKFRVLFRRYYDEFIKEHENE